MGLTSLQKAFKGRWRNLNYEQKDCHDMLVSVGREKKCHADLGFIIFEKLEQKECHADLFVTNVTHFV